MTIQTTAQPLYQFKCEEHGIESNIHDDRRYVDELERLHQKLAHGKGIKPKVKLCVYDDGFGPAEQWTVLGGNGSMLIEYDGFSRWGWLASSAMGHVSSMEKFRLKPGTVQRTSSMRDLEAHIRDFYGGEVIVCQHTKKKHDKAPPCGMEWRMDPATRQIRLFAIEAGVKRDG